MKMRLLVSTAIFVAAWPANLGAAGAEIRIPALSAISSETGAGASYPEAISTDGRYVLVRSSAPNLVPGQTDLNGASDLFLVDRSAGTTTLVSHRAGEPLRCADAGSISSAMSPDGAFVLFTSWASDLVAGGGEAQTDLAGRLPLAARDRRQHPGLAPGRPAAGRRRPKLGHRPLPRRRLRPFRQRCRRPGSRHHR